MIWNIYRLNDERPCARYFFCRYATAERIAMTRFGPEIMVIGFIADSRRLRAERYFSDEVRLPDKGGPYL